MKDKKHGFGKYRWSDGRQYFGYWENGKQHGFGKYIVNGFVQIGKWIKGKRTQWLIQSEVEELEKETKFKRIFANN